MFNRDDNRDGIPDVAVLLTEGDQVYAAEVSPPTPIGNLFEMSEPSQALWQVAMVWYGYSYDTSSLCRWGSTKDGVELLKWSLTIKPGNMYQQPGSGGPGVAMLASLTVSNQEQMTMRDISGPSPGTLSVAGAGPQFSAGTGQWWGRLCNDGPCVLGQFIGDYLTTSGMWVASPMDFATQIATYGYPAYGNFVQLAYMQVGFSVVGELIYSPNLPPIGSAYGMMSWTQGGVEGYSKGWWYPDAIQQTYYGAG